MYCNSNSFQQSPTPTTILASKLPIIFHLKTNFCKKKCVLPGEVGVGVHCPTDEDPHVVGDTAVLSTAKTVIHVYQSQRTSQMSSFPWAPPCRWHSCTVHSWNHLINHRVNILIEDESNVVISMGSTLQMALLYCPQLEPFN